MRFSKINPDFLGFSASIICAVHCLLIPFVLTLGLFGGLSWFHDPLLEWGFILTSVVIACWSLIPSYTQNHHDNLPLLIAVAGCICLLLGRFSVGEWEHFIAALGGLLIALAHFINWKLNQYSHYSSQPARRNSSTQPTEMLEI